MSKDTGTIPGQEEVAHRLAIKDVLHSHSRGLDRLDAQAIKSAYWPDAAVDYGAYKGPARTFAELVVGALADQYELTRHCLSNIMIEFCGDGALAESCVSAGHLLHGGQEELFFHGRYLDRPEQRGGRWKIAHRQVVMDWCRRHAVVDERNSESFVDLAKGGHADSDPLYTFLEGH